MALKIFLESIWMWLSMTDNIASLSFFFYLLNIKKYLNQLSIERWLFLRMREEKVLVSFRIIFSVCPFMLYLCLKTVRYLEYQMCCICYLYIVKLSWGQCVPAACFLKGLLHLMHCSIIFCTVYLPYIFGGMLWRGSYERYYQCRTSG